MEIKIETVHLDAIAVIRPDAFEDERGFFLEAFREDQFRNLGLPWRFVQDNHSRSSKNVVRGLHATKRNK